MQSRSFFWEGQQCMKIHVAFCLKVGTLHEESIICSFGSNMHLPSYHLGKQGLTTSISTGLRGHKCSIIKFLTFPLNRNVSKLDFYSPPSTSILSPPIMEVIVLQLSSFHQHLQIPLPFRKLQGGNHLTMAKTFGQKVTIVE